MTYLALQQIQSSAKPTDSVRETTGRTSRRFRDLRIIHTLDPTRLQSSDFHDISGLSWPTYRADLHEHSSAKVMRSTIFYTRTPSHTTVPFPAGTHGFLYHGSKTSVSRADSTDADHDTKHVGQVRFRITSSSDPTTFANGKDLQLPTGLPWLTYIQGHRRRSASQGCLWELLVRDGHIFDTDASNYRDRKRSRRGTTFHRFGQPFLYNFSHHMVGWTVASESQGGKRVRVHARNPLRPCRIDGSPVVYTGTHI